MKSDYNYRVERIMLPDLAPRKTLAIIIEDEDKGNMSVTNNMEGVVAEICALEKLEEDLSLAIIVYRDSMRLWDGWEYGTKRFYSLEGMTTYATALNKACGFMLPLLQSRISLNDQITGALDLDTWEEI